LEKHYSITITALISRENTMSMKIFLW